MHEILQKLFTKRGIKDITDLSPDEVKDFDRWEKILSEGEITVDKILDFCKAQVTMIEGQMKVLDNSDIKNRKLILLHSVYSSLVILIKAPQIERENLEKYLNTLL